MVMADCKGRFAAQSVARFNQIYTTEGGDPLAKYIHPPVKGFGGGGKERFDVVEKIFSTLPPWR